MTSVSMRTSPKIEQKADVGGAVGIPGNAFAARADDLGLAEGARGHGQGDDGPADDDGHLEQVRRPIESPFLGEERSARERHEKSRSPKALIFVDLDFSLVD